MFYTLSWGSCWLMLCNAFHDFFYPSKVYRLNVTYLFLTITGAGSGHFHRQIASSMFSILLSLQTRKLLVPKQ